MKLSNYREQSNAKCRSFVVYSRKWAENIFFKLYDSASRATDYFMLNSGISMKKLIHMLRCNNPLWNNVKRVIHTLDRHIEMSKTSNIEPILYGCYVESMKKEGLFECLSVKTPQPLLDIDIFSSETIKAFVKRDAPPSESLYAAERTSTMADDGSPGGDPIEYFDRCLPRVAETVTTSKSSEGEVVKWLRSPTNNAETNKH